jgi:hypothetical protein
MGIGYQLNRFFGFELNYSLTNLTTYIPVQGLGSNGFASVDVKFRGYDISFIGTF